MAQTHYVAYPAVLEDSENDTGTYTVTFPDVPGAISEGVGIPDALAKGAEALELMLYDEKRPAKSLPFIRCQSRSSRSDCKLHYGRSCCSC